MWLARAENLEFAYPVMKIKSSFRALEAGKLLLLEQIRVCRSTNLTQSDWWLGC